MTATPQKRQLMLIDAAIRFIQRTRRHWQAQEDDLACESLIRAQEIVSELISSLNPDAAPDLVKQVAALYLFVFRSLLDASLEHDEEKLDDAIRVLQPQREAWQGVCQELGNKLSDENEAAAVSITGAGQAPPSHLPVADSPPIPDLSGDSIASGQESTGFSLEA